MRAIGLNFCRRIPTKSYHLKEPSYCSYEGAGVVVDSNNTSSKSEIELHLPLSPFASKISNRFPLHMLFLCRTASVSKLPPPFFFRIDRSLFSD
jgi:hypothetical protein